MTHYCAFRRTFLCASSWWMTCFIALRSRSAVSRWMVISSRSWSAFARCSSSHYRMSITIWMSCNQERADRLSSLGALTSRRMALLWAINIERGSFVEWLGCWIERSQAYGSKDLNESPNVVGKFFRNQSTHQIYRERVKSNLQQAQTHRTYAETQNGKTTRGGGEENSTITMVITSGLLVR